jgi:hypothetical protein
MLLQFNRVAALRPPRRWPDLCRQSEENVVADPTCNSLPEGQCLSEVDLVAYLHDNRQLARYVQQKSSAHF